MFNIITINLTFVILCFLIYTKHILGTLPSASGQISVFLINSFGKCSIIITINNSYEALDVFIQTFSHDIVHCDNILHLKHELCGKNSFSMSHTDC